MELHKRIGILGGVSPESTRIYYEYITREYVKRYGSFDYPEIIIYSVNFQEFRDWTQKEQWHTLTQKMIEVFRTLEKAGADFGLVTANTLHIVFDELQSESSLPLVSIIDATAEAAKKEEMRNVGLVGTILTMSKDFYKKGLEKNGISTLVPNREDQQFINRVIYEELTKGIIRTDSRKRLNNIIEELKLSGAEGIILGCTEIPLLVKESDCNIRLFDTATIHAEKALRYAIG